MNARAWRTGLGAWGGGRQHSVSEPSRGERRSARIRGARPHAPCPVWGSVRHMVALGGLLIATTGCEWFTDFKRQPHVVTWESWRADSLGVRGAPQGSVPLDGTAVPAWMVSYSPTIATLDSMAGIRHPVARTEGSLADRRKSFRS